MSSKRNHAARSRRSYKWNQIAAKQALRGTPFTYAMRMARIRKALEAMKEQEKHDEQDKQEET